MRSPRILYGTCYYPFGMGQPGRNFSATEYRFGFNGIEKFNDVSGISDHYEFRYREYDARCGRFWSVDPLFRNYPDYANYQFAGNKPIWKIDLLGLKEFDPDDHSTGKPAKDPTPLRPQLATAKDNLTHIPVPEALINQSLRTGMLPEAPIPVKPLPGEGIVYQTPEMQPPALDHQYLQLAKYDPATKAMAVSGVIVVGTVLGATVLPNLPAASRTILQVKEAAETAIIGTNTPVGQVIYGIGLGGTLKAVREQTPAPMGPITSDDVYQEMGGQLFEYIHNWMNSKKPKMLEHK